MFMKKSIKSVGRKILCITLSFAMMTGVFTGCNKKSEKPGKGVNSGADSKIIENYFREDTAFTSPEMMLYVEGLHRIGDKLCFSGWITGGDEEATRRIFVYDKKSGKCKELDGSSLEYNYVQTTFAGDKYLYVFYTPGESGLSVARYKKDTFEFVDANEIVEENQYAFGMVENEDGQLCTYIMGLDESGGTVKDIFYNIYDSEIKLVSSTDILENVEMEEDSVFQTSVGSDDAFYVFIDDPKGRTDMTKISLDGEVVYTVSDVTSDMNGYLSQAFVLGNGNPVVCAKENMGHTSINEFDAQTGEVVGRYDTDLLEGYVLTAQGAVTGEEGVYDLMYITNNKLYGYIMKYDEQTLIYDFNKLPVDGEEIGNCSGVYANDELMVFGSVYYNDQESGTGICITDTDGNILLKRLTSDRTVGLTWEDNEEKMCVLYTQYIYDDVSGTGKVDLTVERSDALGEVTETLKLEGYDREYNPESVCTSKSGEIVLIDYDSLFVFDRDGKKLFDIETEAARGVFSDDSGVYLVYGGGYGEDYSIRVSKINFEGKTLEEVGKLDVLVEKVLPGDEKYDAYFGVSDGIYGYTISDNSINEIVNWINTDVDKQVYNMVCMDTDNIFYSYYDTTNHTECIKKLVRVDDETLKKIQNKKTITLACELPSDALKEKVIEFNRTSDDYRIKLNDYYKYSLNGERGISQLNKEMVTGQIPDIIIGNQQFDVQRYVHMDVFVDLSEYIKKDTLINTEDYFTNIFNAYSYDGKQYQLPLTFRIGALVGKESALEDIDYLDFDKFFSLGKENELFYKCTRQQFMYYLIYNNLSEYVDFKNMKCDFDNDNFINLLEYAKEKCITSEEQEKLWSDEEYSTTIQRMFIDDVCLMELREIYSFEDIAYYKQIYLDGEKPAFLNFPSTQDKSPVVFSDTLVSITKKSQYIDESWDFIKTLFTDESQMDFIKLNGQYFHNFPVKVSVFEEAAKKEMSKTANIHTQDANGKDVLLRNIDKETLGQLREIIEKTTVSAVSDENINSIIEEQSELFFSGGQSAEDTVKAIQNKVSLYMKEIG